MGEGDKRLNVMAFCAILFYLLSESLADCIVFIESTCTNEFSFQNNCVCANACFYIGLIN